VDRYSEEAALVPVAHQGLVHRRGGEVELGERLGQREARLAQAIGGRAGAVVGELGLQELTDDLLDRVPALERTGDDLVVGRPHARELERGHHLKDLVALHQGSPAPAARGRRAS
jgi:hypothetical protein